MIVLDLDNTLNEGSCSPSIHNVLKMAKNCLSVNTELVKVRQTERTLEYMRKNLSQDLYKKVLELSEQNAPELKSKKFYE